MATRRTQRRQETLAEIKAIATRQLSETGATSISLRAIAREMGMTSPALYRYFPNYEALIGELILDAYSSMAEALEAADAKMARDDFGGRFMAFAHTLRNWALANRAAYMLIQGTPIPGYEAPEAVTRPAAQRSWRVALTVFLEAQAAGCLTLPALADRALPQHEAYAALWTEQVGVPFSVPLLHASMATAALFNGLLVAEVSERFPGVSAEVTLIAFETERQRLGLPAPFTPTT